MRVIAVAANKGGVGKSTVALQVAAELALRGCRVLAVDADKQADLTRFAIGPLRDYEGLDAVLADPPSTLDPRPFLRPVRAHLDLLGTSPRLAEVGRLIDRGLDEGPFYLSHALDLVAPDYDWAIIDLGHDSQLLANVVVVADSLLMPTSANFPDAYHATDMLHIAASVRQDLRLPKVDLMQQSAISVWRRSHNASADAIVIRELTKLYGELVSPVVIPNSSRVSEANQQRLTLREYVEEFGTRRDKTLRALVDGYAQLTEFICSRSSEKKAMAI